ncbi:MAG: rhodanese-like domain-containing protein [Candidatus Tectimicrobiota bacterium]
MEQTTASTLHDVDAPTLKAWLETGEALLVDVREAAEYAGEHIPEAVLAPLSTFNASRLPREPGKKMVLHCVMGMRSAQAGQKLLDAGFTTVYNFRGGVQAWKAAGYATEQGQPAQASAALSASVQRQVQAIAGTLVLLSTLLSALLSSWFLVLSGVVGAGLLYAGLSGNCWMAGLLAQLSSKRRA